MGHATVRTRLRHGRLVRRSHRVAQSCNHMCQRLQPYVPEAATICARGCNRAHGTRHGVRQASRLHACNPTTTRQQPCIPASSVDVAAVAAWRSARPTHSCVRSDCCDLTAWSAPRMAAPCEPSVERRAFSVFRIPWLTSSWCSPASRCSPILDGVITFRHAEGSGLL